MALNFPNPDSIQTYTNAGITWTWNPTLGVWSTEANTNEFLSKVNDDTAAGEITFESGINVTGGDATTADITLHNDDSLFFSKRIKSNKGINVVMNNEAVETPVSTINYAFFANDATDDRIETGYIVSRSRASLNSGDSCNHLSLFLASTTDGQPNANVQNQYGFAVANISTAFNTYAFYSSTNENHHQGGTAYAFFGAGNAPNYFGGATTFNKQILSTNQASNGRCFMARPSGNFTCSDTISGTGQFTANAGAGHSTSVPDCKYAGFVVDRSFGANTTIPNSGTLTGFRSEIQSSDANNAYNFYAGGNAKNYFKGPMDIQGNTAGRISVVSLGSSCPSLEIIRSNAASASQNAIEVWSNDKASSPSDLQWKVSWTGVASFSAINGALADVQVQMQADDPAAFTTTFALDEDEDGNEIQVENTTYSGTTESLLDIIRDLRARIEELESNTLQPLYSTFADLPSASDHHGKTAHVHDEGALYFAHAGNWVKLQNA